MTISDAPQWPMGEFQLCRPSTTEERIDLIQQLDATPTLFVDAITGLDSKQLDTKFRNWTIRQIVHHVADSHMHSYIRFKWALTEEQPLIKAYDETAWSELPDARRGNTEASIHMLRGIHLRWHDLLIAMTDEQYDRSFIHPQTNETTDLATALPYYVWHGRHHAAQIHWVREHRLS
ncbi:MAG: YfiT family bacillithiol transferase [Phycisphaerae bacterium]